MIVTLYCIVTALFGFGYYSDYLEEKEYFGLFICTILSPIAIPIVLGAELSKKLYPKPPKNE